MPGATRVAGLYAWNQLGRKVKKGEKGIRILAPIVGVCRKKDAEANRDITKQNERVLLGFRNAYVFERLSRDLRPGFYALDGTRERAYIPDGSQTHHRSTSQSRAMLPWFNWGKNVSWLCPLRDSHEDIV
jgi:hypothetical protein